ncbi:MAG: hypothetical protein ACFFEA_02390 [Candidatus Thorarchaeota archaeon]
MTVTRQGRYAVKCASLEEENGKMSAREAQKRKRKVRREMNKNELRWYTAAFADILDTEHNSLNFPIRDYIALTPRINSNKRLRSYIDTKVKE